MHRIQITYLCQEEKNDFPDFELFPYIGKTQT